MKYLIETEDNKCLLSYYVYGSTSKPLIIMLHGWSRSGQTYDRLAKTLSINYMIVTVDLPGFGSSDHKQFNDKSLEGYTKVVKKFIKKIASIYNKKQLYILGHSFGGRTAINLLANDDLEEFESIKGIFIASSGYNQKGNKDEFELISPEMRAFKEIIVEGYATESLMKKDIDILRQKNQLSKYSFIVINGDKDEAIPVEHSYRLANEIGCQFWMFNKATHDVYLENNRGVATLIHDFIVGMDTAKKYKDSSNIFNRKALQYTNEISKRHLLKRNIIKKWNIFIQKFKRLYKYKFTKISIDVFNICAEFILGVLSLPIVLMDKIRKKFYEDEYLQIGVLFGGRSVEHEVSIQTAILIMNELTKGKNVKVYPIYLYNNQLYYSETYMFTPRNFINKVELTKHSKHIKLFRNDQNKIDLYKEKSRLYFSSIYKKFVSIDTIIISTHGTNSEDGSIASYLEYKQLPYTGSNISSSVIGQDKVLFKYYIHELLGSFNEEYAIAKKTKTEVELVSDFVVLESDFNNSDPLIIDKIKHILEEDQNVIKLINDNKIIDLSNNVFGQFEDEPLYRILTKLDIKVDKYLNITPAIILKPAHLGSSIGISIIKNLNDFILAFSKAFIYDNKVLVEEVITEFRELNCSIKKTVFGVKASKVSEENKDGFYSFEDKYISNKKILNQPKRKFPADLPDEIQSIIQSISAKVYHLLGAKGVVRIDYMYDEQKNTIYLTEINNIPGSFAFYFWEHEDSSIRNFILSVVDDGLKEFRFKHISN